MKLAKITYEPGIVLNSLHATYRDSDKFVG